MQAVPRRGLDVVDLRPLVEAGGRDEHVDGAVRGNGRVDQPPDVLGVRDVHDVRDPAGHLGRGCLDAVGLQVGEHDTGALVRERPAEDVPETAGRPRDENDPAVETEVHGCSRGGASCTTSTALPSGSST